MLDAPPLWYYVLAEARSRRNGGLHLGPVGGRIVAEVLVGLLEADPDSYLQPAPGLDAASCSGRDAGDFTMVDLVKFAGRRSRSATRRA